MEPPLAALVVRTIIVDTTRLKPLSYRDSGNLAALWERVQFLTPEPVGPNPRHESRPVLSSP
jgi:hypothetical protein